MSTFTEKPCKNCEKICSFSKVGGASDQSCKDWDEWFSINWDAARIAISSKAVVKG